jgi:predicted transcriptional regulator
VDRKQQGSPEVAKPLRSTLIFRILKVMEVHFTPELEAKLTQSAAQQGRNPGELVQEVVAQHFEEERRFLEAVNRGEEALARGEFLSHEQVGQRLKRFLQP